MYFEENLFSLIYFRLYALLNVGNSSSEFSDIQKIFQVSACTFNQIYILSPLNRLTTKQERHTHEFRRLYEWISKELSRAMNIAIFFTLFILQKITNKTRRMIKKLIIIINFYRAYFLLYLTFSRNKKKKKKYDSVVPFVPLSFFYVTWNNVSVCMDLGSQDELSTPTWRRYVFVYAL